jgi:hypothetical protein
MSFIICLSLMSARKVCPRYIGVWRKDGQFKPHKDIGNLVALYSMASFTYQMCGERVFHPNLAEKSRRVLVARQSVIWGIPSKGRLHEVETRKPKPALEPTFASR